jgi:hypothetical protein
MDETCYIIMERVHGRPLGDEQFKNSSAEARRQFFVDLINMMTQLRGLEFDAAGSLMPIRRGTFPIIHSLWSSTKPTVVSAISMPINELHTQGGRTTPLLEAPPTSVSEFVAQQYRLLRDIYLMPLQDLEESAAKYEVFALHTIQNHPMVQERLRHRDDQPERFVLTHPDLRGSNIMVDDQLRILAIIDWEWAATVPAAFFTPPLLIMDSKQLLPEFCSVLSSLSSSRTVLLQKEWAALADNDMTICLGYIFQHPYSLRDVFYASIYPSLFETDRKEALGEFFATRQWKEEITRRLESSERYNQYLKANNLYKVDEYRKRLAEWIAEGQALLASKEK